MKGGFDAVTLVDPSAGMRRLSRELNPDCEHLDGDMRSLRLGRHFDAVFVHDAVCYLRTVEELRATMETVFHHTAVGGRALVAPDLYAEDFVETSSLIEGQDGTRSLRCVEWMWDPDPSDGLVRVEYGLLLRDGDEVRMVHDHHVEGLFPKATWVRAMRDAGFEVQVARRHDNEPPYTEELLFGTHPPSRTGVTLGRP